MTTSRLATLALGILGLLPCLGCLIGEEPLPATSRYGRGGQCPDGETCFVASECPATETCAAAADWLFFSGSTPMSRYDSEEYGSEWIAIGGSERFTFATGESPTTRVPYTDAVLVESSDETVIEITAIGSGSFDVRGVGPGHAWVRVLEPTTGHLIDRIGLTAATAQPVRLVPNGHYGELALTRPELALLAGRQAVVTASFASPGSPIVDRGLTVRQGSEIVMSGEDGAPYDLALADPVEATSLTLTLTALGETSTQIVAIVPSVETIRIEIPEEITLESGALICAEPTTASGALVLGASEPVAVADLGSFGAFDGGCAYYAPSARGTESITVMIEGRSTNATFEVR